MSIKISNFVPLNTPAGNDVLPIIDVSEPNTADQNKKITVDNLLSLAGAGGNPYLQTDLTGTFSTNINTSGIILGENNNIVSDEAESSLIIGNNNSLEVTGFFGAGDNNYILGSFNTNKDSSKQTNIVGYLNTVAGDSDYSILIGSESFLGFRTDGYSETSFDSKKSFVGGYKNISLGFSNTVVGNENILYEGSQFSVAIGSNIVINSDPGIGNTATILDNVVTIGEDILNTKSNSLSIGYDIDNLAEGGTALGQYSYIESLAEDSITISGYIENAAVEGIAIGKFSYIRGPGAIAIGPAASCNSTTTGAIAIGNATAARGNSSIVIGENNGVNLNASNSISIGARSGIFSGGADAIVLGTDNNINNNCPGSISIGKGNTIFVSSPNCIALGYNANVATGLSDSIQLGTGTVSTSNTLQFGPTKLADRLLGLVIKTNSIAPTVSASDVGTLGLNAGTPQYVNSAGAWTNFIPPTYERIKIRRITTSQTLPGNAFNTLSFNQNIYSGIGSPIGSFNTTNSQLTLNTQGTYSVIGTLTFSGGAAGTRVTVYSELPLSGSIEAFTSSESTIINQVAGSFVLPVNLMIQVLTGPTTFTFTVGNSTAISLAPASSVITTWVESQLTITKLN